MRTPLALALALAAAGCGQTGSLYLPDETVETPVEIRGPAEEKPAEEKEEEKVTQPPGL
jgi:predicted small lipoprotein YifL